MRLPKSKKIVAQKYVAGLSLIKGKMIKIKLSANESALGPSPKAIKEYNKVSKNFKRYPDTNGTFLSYLCVCSVPDPTENRVPVALLFPIGCI